MENENTLLISALRSAVADIPPIIPDELDWRLFLKLSRIHAVTPLVYDGLRKGDVLQAVPKSIHNALLNDYHTAIFMDCQFDYIKAQLSEELKKAQIPHIFLKGACLKYDYPEPALRTMCDLDVLVYTKDFPMLEKIALELGAKPGHSDGNHRNYHFPGGVTVEFHPNLLHHDTPVGTQINPGWQYAKTDMPTSAIELTPEGFYLNTICHLANHFVMGGVGVRFVLDVWVNRYLSKNHMDRDFVEKELDRFGLLDFAKNIETLADIWFGNGTMTPLLNELGDYIFSSGLHGSEERAMLNAVSLSPGGTGRSALLKKAFYSRQEMEDRFPWCKGKPWLLPVAWCVRAFKAVTKHGNLIIKWSKGTNKFSKKDVKEQLSLLKQFGIDSKAQK